MWRCRSTERHRRWDNLLLASPLRLNITQQALSKQIRELEDKLDLKLLERGHGFCQLTAAGEVFLLEAKRLLFTADEAIEKTRKAAQGEIGMIKFITLVAWYDHIARETSWVVTPRTHKQQRVRGSAQTVLLKGDG